MTAASGQLEAGEVTADVAYDHQTGMIRGILCFSCNSGLGSFKDDVLRVEAAIAYLQHHSQIRKAS